MKIDKNAGVFVEDKEPVKIYKDVEIYKDKRILHRWQ